MLKTLRNKRGVTLVELLAVIIILGIIAAIAVPTIGKLVENSRANAAAASGTNTVSSLALYATDNLSATDTFDFDGVDDPAVQAALELVLTGYITDVPTFADVVFSVSGGLVTVTAGADATIDGYDVTWSGTAFERE